MLPLPPVPDNADMDKMERRMGKLMRKFVLPDSSSDHRTPPVAYLAQRCHARELASAAAQEQKPPSTFAPPIRRVRRPPVQSEVATSFPTASCTCSTSLRRRPAAGPSPPSDCSSGHPPPALAALQASPRHDDATFVTAPDVERDAELILESMNDQQQGKHP